MPSSEHTKILRLAAEGKLPDRIDKNGNINVAVVHELFERGLVEATNVSSLDGYAYLNPRITFEGRAYLDSSLPKSWWRAKWVTGLIVTVFGGLLVAAIASLF